MMTRSRQAGISMVCALMAGCWSEPLGIAPPAAPAFDAASVAPNPQNVLSAVVAVRVRGADSVAVRFHLADSALAGDGVTAAVAVADGAAVIPVLGLLAASRYALRAVAHGPGGTTVGGALELTTDTLPSDLPRYVAAGSDPAPGYVVFAAGRYGLAIDNAGRVVWYRRFPNGPGLAFMAEPTGRYYARLPPALPTDPAPWVELDPLGNLTRTFGCLEGLAPRFHDLIAQIDGTYWLMCDEIRTMDLSGVGGLAGAHVTGTVVQHISAEGALLFQWSPFDHFAITDGDPRDRAGSNVNWTHGNALDLGSDGNLLVSFRNLGEITKIDATTGDVIWRLGGRRNRFAFLDAPATAFMGQHSARSYAPGAVLLLDNLGDATASRAERYVLDETKMTARLVGSYGSVPGVVTEIGGSVQDLPGGHTLVSFGIAGRVEEYDATGRVMWRIEQNAGYVFRAQRIGSLYAPGVGMAR
jgi:hypothetical protein